MKTIKLLLIIAGCAALFMGIALAAVATSPLLTASTTGEMAAHRITYMGGGTCVTCHENGSASWVNAPGLRYPENSIHNPLTSQIPVRVHDLPVLPGVEVDFIAGQTDTLAGSHHQQYVLFTEAGYLLLPTHWQVNSPGQLTTPISPQADALERCSGCHLDDFSAATGIVTTVKHPPPSFSSTEPMQRFPARLIASIIEEYRV